MEQTLSSFELKRQVERQLREYQQRIVEKVVNSTKDQIICLPTGAGKTVIASAFMRRLPLPVVFVVPRLELILQAEQEFGDVDIIWSDKTRIEGKQITVASKDTLRTQYKKIKRDVILVFDEAHIGIEATSKLVKLIKPKRVLGLTATPERMDRYALLKGYDAKGEEQLHKFGVFDELIQSESVPTLIEKGYLTKLRYYTRPIEGITEIKSIGAGEELTGEQMTEIFDSHALWGDIVASYEEYGKDRPALGFTLTIEMAEKVVKLFKSAGYDFRVIHGGMSIKERSELIDLLRTRKIHGLVNASLLTYGFDCPVVSYAFSCRHIKSRPLWFQIVGRILRVAEGKEDTVFVDHGDSIAEFAQPNMGNPILDPCIDWRVDGWTKEQKKAEQVELKRVRQAMDILQELDPQPVGMVEVLPGNMWDRFLKVIQNLRAANKKLKNEKHQLGNLVQKLNEETQNLSREKEELQQRAVEAANTITFRYIDPDKTFNFCKKSYSAERERQHNALIGTNRYWSVTASERVEMEHRLTIDALMESAKSLPFLIDERTFENSMGWWKTHWMPKDEYFARKVQQVS